MVRRQPLHRRWSTAARWPAGILLAAYRYLWATTPVHRWEMEGTWAEDAPPPLPEDVQDDDLQRIEDGVGPMLHRLYRTRIVAVSIGPEELIGRLREDLDEVAPSEFATFQRLDGGGRLERGDEYVVRMPGPWDGPVRAVAATPTWFRLATLSGHLEAGQIEFRAVEVHRGLCVEIESWARNGDRLSDLLYTRLRFSKEVQLHMWVSVLRRIVGLTGGKMEGGIAVTTRRVKVGELTAGERADERGDGRLEKLAARPLNFDPERLERGLAGAGWRHDDLVEPLPGEVPGPPVEGGSWAVAREIMDRYQLADPRLVRADFDREAPLSGRDMLLRVRFGPLFFRVGVRVGAAREQTLQIEGREAHVSGWSYRTLAGHFEEGEMHYELWKWLDSGDVEFRLRAASRPARHGPLLTRIGFRLFGRSPQLRFYRQACRRIRRLTEARLEAERAAAARAELETSPPGQLARPRAR